VFFIMVLKFNIGDFVFHQSDNTYGQVVGYRVNGEQAAYAVDFGVALGCLELLEFQIEYVKNPHIKEKEWE